VETTKKGTIKIQIQPLRWAEHSQSFCLVACHCSALYSHDDFHLNLLSLLMGHS